MQIDQWINPNASNSACICVNTKLLCKGGSVEALRTPCRLDSSRPFTFQPLASTKTRCKAYLAISGLNLPVLPWGSTANNGHKAASKPALWPSIHSFRSTPIFVSMVWRMSSQCFPCARWEISVSTAESSPGRSAGPDPPKEMHLQAINENDIGQMSEGPKTSSLSVWDWSADWIHESCARCPGISTSVALRCALRCGEAP